MVLEAIVGAICNAVGFMIGALPLANSAAFDLSGLGSIIGRAEGFNAHLPVAESLAALVVCIAYFNASVLYQLGNWVYRHIPFVS
jgi:hypothetical protein